jgi:hypothetical protein
MTKKKLMDERAKVLTEYRNHERRIRRMLAKDGLSLAKWRCPWLNSFGYEIRDAQGKRIAGYERDLSLGDVLNLIDLAHKKGKSIAEVAAPKEKPTIEHGLMLVKNRPYLKRFKG